MVVSTIVVKWAIGPGSVQRTPRGGGKGKGQFLKGYGKGQYLKGYVGGKSYGKSFGGKDGKGK